MTTFVVGSLAALGYLLEEQLIEAGEHYDVVVVPTAAAFSGLDDACEAISTVFDVARIRVEAAMVSDRVSSSDKSFAQRIRSADCVVLSDGSALHAKSVWHSSLVGDAIRGARRLIAVGSCATVLGDVMIDPRGGAPMAGLGYRSGLVTTTPANKEQLVRTRELLGAGATLAVVGPRGVLGYDGSTWRQLHDDVVVTRGNDYVAL